MGYVPTASDAELLRSFLSHWNHHQPCMAADALAGVLAFVAGRELLGPSPVPSEGFEFISAYFFAAGLAARQGIDPWCRKEETSMTLGGER